MLNCKKHIYNVLSFDVISAGSNLPAYCVAFVHVLFLRVACVLLAVTVESWNLLLFFL
jgi:hypothetical protein